MRPRDAKCFDDAASKLRRDSFSTPDFWIMFDGDEATICQQRAGSEAEESITVPRKDFVRMTDWFYRNQGPR